MSEEQKIVTVNVNGIAYEVDLAGYATGRFMDVNNKPGGYVPQIVGQKLLSDADKAPKFQSWEFG